MTEYGYYIVESSMNGKSKDHFEIIESKATLANKSFREEIKDSLHHYGLTIQCLAKSIHISVFRLSCLINGNAEFEQAEIELIRKRLHI